MTALPFITLASAPILFGTLYTYDEATDTCKLTHWGNKMMSWPQISHLVHSNDGPQCLRACSPSIGAAATSLAWGCSLLQYNQLDSWTLPWLSAKAGKCFFDLIPKGWTSTLYFRKMCWVFEVCLQVNVFFWLDWHKSGKCEEHQSESNDNPLEP